ncbi:MAG: hypothetical protein LBM70_07920 [Victivallales bacterium]|jgi:hypothetical protein|nr:hypothetical protein [Victivallales bacterium]
MSDFVLNTPILFTIFNRPDTTSRVFDAIRLARPPKLFIAADGPRPDRPGEAELTEKTREIVHSVDWDCEVQTRFLDTNHGCRVAMSSAIDWFFSQVEEGIILEDDCLPSPSFFRYCQEMLAYFRLDERIINISGCNMQLGRHPVKESYYFSRYVHIWGWASYRRAWQHYRVDMPDYPDFRSGNAPEALFPDPKERKRWLEILDLVYAKSPHFNTWDFQWNYVGFKRNALSVTPNHNLVQNLGCTAESLHTAGNAFADAESEEMPFPLIHPEFLYPHPQADHFTFKHDFANPLSKRVGRYLARKRRKSCN